MNNYKTLKEKINKKRAKICIVGLGYVGLPLVVAFGKKSYSVLGYDTNKDRIERLKKGKKYILDVEPKEIVGLIKQKKFFPTTNKKVLREADVIIICVPTPLRRVKIPDVSYVVRASKTIKKYLRKNQLIILESTTYPTTTREVVLPILEQTGLKEGKDFFLCFSPERVNPGDKNFSLTKIPKVVGGLSNKSSQLAKSLYSKIIKKVVTVSSPEIAESAKLLENTFRLVNIALVNEFAIVAEKLGIDVWEIIEAAKTKPFGFMPFYPGPGVGGHCLDGEEVIFVKNEKGLCSLKFLNEIFEEISNNGCLRHKFRGVELLKPKNLQILSFDLEKKRTVFKPVKLVSKRRTKEKIYKIITEGRKKIALTEKHPVIMNEDKKFNLKWAKDLREGENVPFINDLPKNNGSFIKNIDLITELKDSFLEKKIRVKSLSFHWKEYINQMRKLNITSEKIHDYIRGNYLPLAYLREMESRGNIKIKHNDLILCTGRGPSYSEFSARVDLDNDFWRLLGYYFSEGCITKDKSLRVRFTFNREEKECIEDVVGILNKKNIKYSLYKSKRWKSLNIKVSSNILGFLIKDVLCCGIDSYTMKIPDILFSQPFNTKIELLKGILRGDGGVDIFIGKRRYSKNGRKYSHYHNTATINYYSISKKLFHQVIYLLYSMQVIPSFKKRENLLLISGYQQLKKFRNFFLDDKKNKLERYFNSRLKDIPNRNFTSHKQFITAKIRNIEKIKSDYVYSVEVDGTNTFVTSYGMVVHNCIPADPVYLSWKAKKLGFKTKMIDLASFMNHFMPKYVVQRVAKLLKKKGMPLKQAKVLVLGVTYKKNVKDLREAPALDIIEELQKKSSKVDYFDPFIPYLKINNINLRSIPFNIRNLRKYDCILIVTDHSRVNYDFVKKHSKLIFDTRNIYKKEKDKDVVRL